MAGRGCNKTVVLTRPVSRVLSSLVSADRPLTTASVFDVCSAWTRLKCAALPAEAPAGRRQGPGLPLRLGGRGRMGDQGCRGGSLPLGTFPLSVNHTHRRPRYSCTCARLWRMVTPSQAPGLHPTEVDWVSCVSLGLAGPVKRRLACRAPRGRRHALCPLALVPTGHALSYSEVWGVCSRDRDPVLTRRPEPLGGSASCRARRVR